MRKLSNLIINMIKNHLGKYFRVYIVIFLFVLLITVTITNFAKNGFWEQLPDTKYPLFPEYYSFFADGRFQVVASPTNGYRDLSFIEMLPLSIETQELNGNEALLQEVESYYLYNNFLYLSGFKNSEFTYLVINLETGEQEKFTSFHSMSESDQLMFEKEADTACLEDQSCYQRYYSGVLCSYNWCGLD